MNLSATPAAIQQQIEALLDENTNPNVKNNYAMMLKNTKDCIILALDKHTKNVMARRK